MLDAPGPLDSLEVWEHYLAKVKTLPDDAIEREPMVRCAEEMIATIRKNEQS